MSKVITDHARVKEFLKSPFTEELLEREAPDMRGKKRLVEMLCNQMPKDIVIKDTLVVGDLLAIGESHLLRIPALGRKTLNAIQQIMNGYGLRAGMLYAHDTYEQVKDLPSDERINHYLEVIKNIEIAREYKNTESDFVGMILNSENVAKIIPGIRENPSLSHHYLDRGPFYVKYKPMVAGDLLFVTRNDLPGYPWWLGKEMADALENMMLAQNLEIGMFASDTSMKNMFEQLPAQRAEKYREYLIEHKIASLPPQSVEPERGYENTKGDFVGMVLSFESVSRIIPVPRKNRLAMGLYYISRDLGKENNPAIAGDLLALSPAKILENTSVGIKTVGLLEQTVLAQNLRLGMLSDDPAIGNILNKPPAERAEIYRGCLLERKRTSLPPKTTDGRALNI